jgi:CRISPR-associated protein (TIGR03986 family)
MTRIRQASQIGPDRAMPAPYNFVPVPEDVFVPGEPVPNAMEFAPGHLSGVVEYTVRTLSPTYTRGANGRSASGAPNPEFYHHGDPNKPVLPGATMRGLLRSMVGLVADAHLPRTKRNRTLFFRSFGSDALARVYGERFIEQVPSARGPKGLLRGYRGKAEPGFLAKREGRWIILPAWALRVGHRHLGTPHVPPPGRSRADGRPIGIPNPDLQHRPVWFKAASLEPNWVHHAAQTGGGMYTWGRYVDAFSLSEPTPREGWYSGWLVITGPMQKKLAEYVFTGRGPAEAGWPVDDDLVAQVNDAEDQISPWQADAFPPDGRFHAPEGDGGPPGLPVWCLRDPATGRVAALGRTANFRLRYERKIDENVPAEVRYPEVEPEDAARLDLADRVFGYVRQPEGDADQAAQRRGRVRFHDAPCVDANPFLRPLANARTPDRIPLILAAPKPTAYQMYLVQTQSEKLSLTHFGKEGALIRGVKLYWHKNEPGPDGTPQPLPEREMFRTDRADRPGSQETVIRPVRAGVRFAGEIAFHNLTPLELGALLTALDLPDGMAHHVGMGKPLGMGSVRIEGIRVRLLDRRDRYRTWGKTGEKPDGEVEPIVASARDAFRRAMVAHARRAYHVDFADETSVWELPRQQTLALLLSWGSPPPARRTRPVTVQGEDGKQWRERKVLPAPHTVAGAPDPYARVPISRSQALAPVLVSASPGPSPHVGRPATPMAPARARPVEREDPDTLPHNARAEATITGGGPGSWKATLLGGKKTWNVKGTPPPGVRPKREDTIIVRIQRGPQEHLIFDQSIK